MKRLTVIAISTLAVASLIFVNANQAPGQHSSNDTERTTSRPVFGSIRAEVGTGVSVERQLGSNHDERAFIPVDLPGIGDTLLVDKAELVISLSLVPETTVATAVVVRGSAALETSEVTVRETTSSPAIALFPATVPASARSAEWPTEWDEMTGGFDPEFLVLVPVSFDTPEIEAHIDVTEIVRRWMSGLMPINGFVVKSFEEDKSAFHWIRDARYSGQDARLDLYYSRNPLSAP